MDVAGFKGFNGFNPAPGSITSELLQRQVSLNQQAQQQRALFFGQGGTPYGGQFSSPLQFSTPSAAPTQSQNPAVQPQQGTGQTQYGHNPYSSSLQNQFAMQFLYSMMQSMMALNSGFGGFLGAY